MNVIEASSWKQKNLITRERIEIKAYASDDGNMMFTLSVVAQTIIEKWATDIGHYFHWLDKAVVLSHLASNESTVKTVIALKYETKADELLTLFKNQVKSKNPQVLESGRELMTFANDLGQKLSEFKKSEGITQEEPQPTPTPTPQKQYDSYHRVVLQQQKTDKSHRMIDEIEHAQISQQQVLPPIFEKTIFNEKENNSEELGNENKQLLINSPEASTTQPNYTSHLIDKAKELADLAQIKDNHKNVEKTLDLIEQLPFQQKNDILNTFVNIYAEDKQFEKFKSFYELLQKLGPHALYGDLDNICKEVFHKNFSDYYFNKTYNSTISAKANFMDWYKPILEDRIDFLSLRMSFYRTLNVEDSEEEELDEIVKTWHQLLKSVSEDLLYEKTHEEVHETSTRIWFNLNQLLELSQPFREKFPNFDRKFMNLVENDSSKDMLETILFFQSQNWDQFSKSSSFTTKIRGIRPSHLGIVFQFIPKKYREQALNSVGLQLLLKGDLHRSKDARITPEGETDTYLPNYFLERLSSIYPHMDPSEQTNYFLPYILTDYDKLKLKDDKLI